MKRGIKLFLILIVATYSCVTPQSNPSVEPQKENYIPVSNVPLRQKVDTFDLHLETHLWRDFMPSVPVGGPLLNSLIYLTETSGKEIVGKFELLSLKIVAEKVWQPTFSNQPVSIEKNKVSRLSQDGPMIDTGRFVDVVCEYKYLKTGKIYEILASKQKIERAE